MQEALNVSKLIEGTKTDAGTAKLSAISDLAIMLRDVQNLKSLLNTIAATQQVCSDQLSATSILSDTGVQL